MKKTCLALCGVAWALAAGVAQADDFGFADYLRRAKAEAVLDVDGIDLRPGLALKLRVGGDGRLYGARVIESSGSLETDRKVARALRFMRVADPPVMLVAGAITLRVDSRTGALAVEAAQPSAADSHCKASAPCAGGE